MNLIFEADGREKLLISATIIIRVLFPIRIFYLALFARALYLFRDAERVQIHILIVPTNYEMTARNIYL